MIAVKLSREYTQGPDPRVLPEHRLLRPRHLRHPGGGAGLLRRGRRAADHRAGRAARRRCCARPATTTRRCNHGQAVAAVALRPRRHGLDRAPDRAAGGHAEVPGDQAAGGNQLGRRRAGSSCSSTRSWPTSGARHLRRRRSTTAAHDPHDDRQEGAARRAHRDPADVHADLTKKQHNLKDALVAVNPADGGVLAYYGGTGPGVKGCDGKVDFYDYARQGVPPAGLVVQAVHAGHRPHPDAAPDRSARRTSRSTARSTAASA